jgi:hypothetical protein
MKVSELIAKLQTLPQDLEVVSGTFDAAPIVDAKIVNLDEDRHLCGHGTMYGKPVVAFAEGDWRYNTNIFDGENPNG